MDQFTRIIPAFIGIVLIFMLSGPQSAEAEESTFEVSSNVLNVRAEPAADGKIIGMLSKGDRLVVFEEKYGWSQTYYGGKVAWVASHHLLPVRSLTSSVTKAANPVSADTVTIAVSSAHIRSGPGLAYEPTHSTVKGDTYQLVGTKGEWTRVMLPDGSDGWIASRLTGNTPSDATEKSQPSSEHRPVESNATPPQPAVSPSGSLEGHNIFIDPGHGGKDPGAIGLGGVYEKDLVISTADKLERKLTEAGATVIMSRSGDYFVSLQQRAAISNAYETHAFISLHYDAYPAMAVRGISTYYANGEGFDLAQKVHASLASSVNMKNRGVMQANFSVLRNTSAPGILMELGFLSNPDDLAAITTADYQNRAAEAITQGLIDYFN